MHRPVVVISILTPLLFLSGAVPASAQDAHYWTNQYGTRADLLGGVVVGSIADLSSTFYNPGMLALTRDPELVISTNAVRWIRIDLEDGAGEGIPLSSTRLAPAPSIVAIRLGWRPFGGQLAISYLERYKLDVEVVGRRIDSRDIVSGGGTESFSGELASSNKLSEYWGGISWASPVLMDGLGLGATWYVAYRSQKGRFQTLAQAVSDTASGAAVVLFDEFDYYNARTLLKIGASYEWNVFKVGIALTTPSIDLFGGGHTVINAGVINLDTDGDGERDSELAANYQKDLAAHFRSPLSVAAGVSYRFGKRQRGAVHFTAEYFSRQKQFDVLVPGPFPAQTTGDVIDRKFTHEAEPVFNWGVGGEYRPQKKMAFYAAFITDNSYRPAGVDPLQEISVSNWDIRHVSFGSAFTVKNLDFTAGLSYGWGRDTFNRPVDFTNAGEADDLRGKRVPKDVSYNSVKLLLGFSFPL